MDGSVVTSECSVREKKREKESEDEKEDRFYKKKKEKNNYDRVEDLAPPCRQFGYGLIQFFQD